MGSIKDQVQVELLKLCKDMHAPLYTFDQLMQWAANVNTKGYQFKQNYSMREALLNRLFAEYNMNGVITRIMAAILEDGAWVEVVTFDFEQMVLSIHSDSELMQEKNFVFKLADLCAPPAPYNVVDIEITSYLQTSGYTSAYQHLHVEETDVIFPIQMITDKTHLNDLIRLHLEPMIFTFTLFNQESKNRVLGIP